MEHVYGVVLIPLHGWGLSPWLVGQVPIPIYHLPSIHSSHIECSSFSYLLDFWEFQLPSPSFLLWDSTLSITPYKSQVWWIPPKKKTPKKNFIINVMIICDTCHYGVSKLQILCTICHNKHHILYIVIDETTQFTSPMCRETLSFKP
jgi:hypothetical protein